MEDHQEPNQAQVEASQSAANAADNIHPSHWEPVKEDINSEQELLEQAAELPSSNAESLHGEEISAQFDGVVPVRA